MDNNLTDYVQDVDNGDERDQAMEDCLRNSVIVRNILEHISSKELLQISLVNKLWKYEARSVVSQRGNLIANLRSNQYRWDWDRDGCEAVKAFVSDLPKLGSILFSTISFHNNFFHHFCSYPPMDLASIHDAHLLDQLSLKSLTIDMPGPWLEFRDCPAFLLAVKLLEKFCEVLEELELNISEEHGDFIENIIQFCKFPRLKILKVTARTSNLDNENYLKALLSRAPKVEMLYTNWNINSALQLLQGTSVGLVYTTTVRAPFDEISENFISAIKLQSLELRYCGPEFNLERYNRIAPMLLQASCTTTLREIFVEAELAVSLMCYGVRLENVKYLRLFLNYSIVQLNEPRILEIVKKFDFTRIFPNLKKVCIDDDNYFAQYSQNHMNGIIQQANDVLTMEPVVDRAVRVKELVFCDSSAAPPFFAEMFPNIEKLVINKAGRISFGSFWNWSGLKEIQVGGHLLPTIVRRLSRFRFTRTRTRTTGDLDSVFCGIFPEEVAELRLKDDEYLKRVHIVPVMPAITCLRSLRTLTMHHKHDHYVPYGDATFMFSKVTTLLAFARLPALAVSLKISADGVIPAMDHLEPYMSISTDRLGHEDWDN